MLVFDPVWVTSRSHLRDLVGLYEGLSWFRKFFFPPAAPAGFPAVRILGNPTAIVYFATGAVGISEDQLTFQARPPEPTRHNLEYFDVDDSLSFSLPFDSTPGLDSFEFESPIISRLRINWIVLRGLALPGGELLLSVGGHDLNFKRQRARTDELRAAIAARLSNRQRRFAET